MTSHETVIAERLHAAASGIPVDVALERVVENSHTTVVGRTTTRRWTWAAGIAVAAGIAAVLGVAGLAPSGDTVETGRRNTASPTPSGPLAPHVVSPPAWFGEPDGAYRDTGFRTGRWVSMAIGRASGDTVGTPIVVSVFDGTYEPLAGGETVTIDGAALRSVRNWEWEALATDGTPTVMVAGSTDRDTLHAVLEAVEVTDPTGEPSLRLTSLPDGYAEVVSPRVLGPNVEEGRVLAGASGHAGIDVSSDWPDPLLAAAFTGADLTAVDVDGATGWAGLTAASSAGPLRFLIWSPHPGVVFEITTDDPARTRADLVDLALTTSAMPIEAWDTTYAD